MTEETAAADPATGEAIAIPAALPPAKAPDLAARLAAALAAARAEGAPLALEIEGEGAQPCAVQLLVAALREAGGGAPGIRLGPRAAALRSGLVMAE
jgi:hypothetical protein